MSLPLEFTPLTAILLGVSATDVPGPNCTTRKEIKLLDLDMSVPCDVEMISVAGTPDGQILYSRPAHKMDIFMNCTSKKRPRRADLVAVSN